MKRRNSYQGWGVRRAHPIPRLLDLSLAEDRGSASLLLDTQGVYATCEPLMGSLVVVWLHPDGASELLTSN